MDKAKYSVAVSMFETYCEFWMKELANLKIVQEYNMRNPKKNKKVIEDMTAFVESSPRVLGYGVKHDLTEAYNLTIEMIGKNSAVDEAFAKVCKEIENFPKL